MAAVDIDYNDPSYNIPGGAQNVSTKITVDPERLWSLADFLDGIVDQVASVLDGIYMSLEPIRIMWAGADQREAEAFLDDLQARSYAVFGDDEDTTISAKEGSLLKVLAGIRISAQNHGGAERYIKQDMDEFTAAIALPSGTPVAPPDDHGARDRVGGPVVEKNDPLIDNSLPDYVPVQ